MFGLAFLSRPSHPYHLTSERELGRKRVKTHGYIISKLDFYLITVFKTYDLYSYGWKLARHLLLYYLILASHDKKQDRKDTLRTRFGLF